MKDEVVEQIESLVQKASEAAKSEDAMRYSQAACNAANAMACIANIQAAKGQSNRHAIPI